MDDELRPDIEAARAAMQSTFGAKNEVRHLAEYLEADEQVHRLAGGRFGKGNGLLVLTDRRVMFVFHGIFQKSFEEFRLPSISAVALSGGFTLSSVILTVPGAKASIADVDKRDAKAMVDGVRRAIAVSNDPQPVAVAPDPSSLVMEQLEKLGALRASGILTEAEFAAKKADLLARL